MTVNPSPGPSSRGCCATGPRPTQHQHARNEHFAGTRCQAVLLPHLALGYFVALSRRLWLGGVVSVLAWVVATIAVMPISARGPVAALFLPVIGLPLPLAALAALDGGRR